MTPFQTGRYWYDTVMLPTGVEAELVVMATGAPGVRFMFKTVEQGEQLAGQLKAFGASLGESVARLSGSTEPPEVGS